MQFYKERVDYWSDKFRSTHSGGVIPSIQLKATLDGDSVCDLSQKLILEGVIGENNWLQVSITKRDISGIINSRAVFATVIKKKSNHVLEKAIIVSNILLPTKNICHPKLMFPIIIIQVAT